MLSKELSTDNRFENLYMGNQPRLVAYAMKFVETREAALDIVQDSFINIWEKYRLMDDEQARKLLFKMVRNACLNYLKRSKFTNPLVDLSHDSTIGQELLYNFDFSFPSTEEAYLMKECRAEIRQVLEHLPDRCREVFELRIYNGLKNREIAESLNISVKAVEKHIKKALSIFDDSVKSESSMFFKMLILLWMIGLN